MTTVEIIRELMLREGGFINHPSDEGGPTNYGITQRELSEYLGRPATIDDVKHLDPAIAVEIYNKKYLPPWQFIWYDPLRILMIDTGVLHGMTGARKILQRALGVKDDGIIGPNTRAALDAVAPEILCAEVIKERILREVSIALAEVPGEIKETTDLAFLKGWINRSLSFM